MPLSKKDQILDRFTCQNTGNCCRAPGQVYVTIPDIITMSEILGLSIIDFREKYVRKHNNYDVIATATFRPDCFLDANNKCQVYAARPKYCRDYPNVKDVWTSDKAVDQESSRCPGLQLAIKLSE